MIRNEGGYVKDVATHCLVRFERTRDQCHAYIHFWLHQGVKIGIYAIQHDYTVRPLKVREYGFVAS